MSRALLRSFEHRAGQRDAANDYSGPDGAKPSSKSVGFGLLTAARESRLIDGNKNHLSNEF
jgi:hypothetical protein